jgi:hypothetical protein
MMERLATMATRARRHKQVHLVMGLAALVTAQIVGLLVLL